jgi:thiamine-monophosphate kinase
MLTAEGGRRNPRRGTERETCSFGKDYTRRFIFLRSRRDILTLTMARMSELGLIERIRSASAAVPMRRVLLGIGDDCAILRPPRGHEILVTTDFLLEGRHFRRDWHTPESAGHRCLARGLSDLAAMGAKPLAAFLSLALPGEMLATRAGRAWVDGFFHGLRALGDRMATPLAGGDTAEAPGSEILADIVLLGSAPAGRAIRRSGGRSGDALYITGSLGGAAAELAQMKAVGSGRRRKRSAEHPQLFPEPRAAVGEALLRRRLATACIDLSDGLSTDLAHLCEASGVGADLDAAALPIHSLAAATSDPLDLALHGGEDYELLFTADAHTRIPRRIAGVPVARIGSLTAGRKVNLVAPGRRPRILKPGGWEHFASDAKKRPL